MRSIPQRRTTLRRKVVGCVVLTVGSAMVLYSLAMVMYPPYEGSLIMPPESSIRMAELVSAIIGLVGLVLSYKGYRMAGGKWG